MQIFTVEMLIEMRSQAREIAQALLKNMLDAAWQSANDYFPTLFAAVSAKDWNEVAIHLLVLMGCVAFLFRLGQKLLFYFLRGIDF